MACHPHDPAMPGPFRGVAQRVLSSPAGLQKLLDLHPSPFHGLNCELR